MPFDKWREIAQKILSRADVEINGDRPWDIHVNNEGFYKRVLSRGSLGLGEAYLDGWWDAKALDEFFARILLVDTEKIVPMDWKTALWFLGQTLFNPQRKSKSSEVGQYHYDLGNDFYQAMLDKRMVYTCACWKNARDLDEAQEAKLDLVCQKLGVQKSMKVLDVGCGWGSFAKYAAEKYGASVTGITISKEQVELGKKLCDGLAVEIKLQDYREVEGMYDRIVSLGMFEHVGYKNYRTYMKVMHEHLCDGGLLLLQTIGRNESAKTGDPWFEKYIFPNSMLPSIAQIGAAAEGLFVIEDWHNLSTDYDKTALAWFKNFDQHWQSFRSRYGDRFYRMWKYYLLASAGAFRARKSQLWQIVLSKNGVPGGYKSIR